MFPAACQACEKVRHRRQSPYRLVVRTSRRGRDNPGSNPGVDMRPGTTIREDRLRTVAYQPAVPGRCAAVLMSMGTLAQKIVSALRPAGLLCPLGVHVF